MRFFTATLSYGIAIFCHIANGHPVAQYPSSPWPTSQDWPLPAPQAPAPRPPPGPTAQLWQPRIGEVWQIALQGANANSLPSGIKIIDVDLIDITATEIKAYKDQQAKIICYFSGGSWEEWRNDWRDSKIKDSDLGLGIEKEDGTYWPGEKWVDIRSQAVRDVMETRIKLAKQKGCDAVDPDNIDGFDNNNGLGLKNSDSVDFVRFLASKAHPLGLSLALKNAASIIPQVLDVVQFSVQEECQAQNNCQLFSAFTAAGKPIFNIEYPEEGVQNANMRQWCNTQGSQVQLSTVVKELGLDTEGRWCDGRIVTGGGGRGGEDDTEDEGEDEGDDKEDDEDEAEDDRDHEDDKDDEGEDWKGDGDDEDDEDEDEDDSVDSDGDDTGDDKDGGY